MIWVYGCEKCACVAGEVKVAFERVKPYCQICGEALFCRATGDAAYYPIHPDRVEHVRWARSRATK